MKNFLIHLFIITLGVVMIAPIWNTNFSQLTFGNFVIGFIGIFVVIGVIVSKFIQSLNYKSV